METVLEYADLIDAGEEYENHSLYEMAPTKLRKEKSSSGPEKVIWIRGDVPVFDGGEVEVGQTALKTAAPVDGNARAPDFEASEYARILHVFIDTRMRTAIQQLMEPRTRGELDRAPIDPWCDHIAHLFNDYMFKPAAINNVCVGVTRADIATIDPGKKVHDRDGGLLKRKFANFKSEYGTSVTRYEASGQGDPDIFREYARGRIYLIYGFCFFKQHPVLQPLATRALQTDAQREVASGKVCRPVSRRGNQHESGNESNTR